MRKNLDRMTAFLSQDPNMIKAYLEGKDLYAMIAQAAFNNRYEDNLEFYPEGTELEIDGEKVIAGNKTHKNPAGKDRRSVGKVLLLASTYGMSGATAGARLNKTKEEGQQLLDNFFAGFPKVKETIEWSKQFLKKNGYVEDFVGRRRHLPDYYLKPYEAKYRDPEKMLSMTFNPFFGCNDREPMDKVLQSYVDQAFKTRGNKEFTKLQAEANKKGIILTANTGRIAQAERQCFNARIQGSAASLTNIAMVDIFHDKELKQYHANLIASVHDEVLVECPEFYADKVEERLPQVMVNAAKPYTTIPQKCDPYNVSRWYLEEYSAMILDEYKNLTTKENKDSDTAIEIICKNHSEAPAEAIRTALINHTDIEF